MDVIREAIVEVSHLSRSPTPEKMPPSPALVSKSVDEKIKPPTRSVSTHSLNATEFIRPDLPSRCKWAVNSHEVSPHTSLPARPSGRVLPNILHQIGSTPMVRLNKIPRSMGVQCEVYAKCEFFNAGGSVKDRIALRMVEDAEKAGSLKPGSTLIEPTSGNTGIGLALAAAVKGYRAIIVMPEKMSNEKVSTLRALGAEIVRTPTSASWDSPESHISVAQRLQKEIPDAVILDQYRNEGNPLAHYDTTAEEVLEQCDQHLDMIVIGAGTGGTACGIGRKLKERCPECVVVGVDPHGSILAHEPGETVDAVFYEVEGIGYDFYPTVFDRSVVDRWQKTGDAESLRMARRLIREEGLLCGGSSGAAVWAACIAARDLPATSRVVCILPDGVRNYMTKFLDDDWMMQRHFISDTRKNNHDNWWWDQKVSVLNLAAPFTVTDTVECQEAIDIMNKEGFDQLPVMDEHGDVLGMITLGSLMSKLVSGKVKPTSIVAEALYSRFHKVQLDETLGNLSRILEKDHFVLIVHEQKLYGLCHSVQKREVIIGIVTQIDLLSYIMGGADALKNNFNACS